MNTELAPLEKTIEQMEAFTNNYTPMYINGLSILKQALAISTVKSHLAALMNQDFMEQVVLPLKDDDLGFLTDEAQQIKRGGRPYSIHVIRNCAIGVILRGLRLTNNEFNIIRGRVYATQNGFAHLMYEFPGLSDLVVINDTPKTMPGGALVGFAASWKLNNSPMKLERKDGQAIAVKLYDDQGADVAIGKGLRKMYKFIYLAVTGSRHAMPDGEVDDMELGDVTPHLPAPQAAPQLSRPGQTAAVIQTTPQRTTTPGRRPRDGGFSGNTTSSDTASNDTASGNTACDVNTV